ncbi:MAG: hypothetical protein ABI807_10620 [Sporichthyaceae bacterium]
MLAVDDAVVDHREVAVRRADHGHQDPAVVGCLDDRATGEVGARVQLGVVQDRMEPHAERRGHDAVQEVDEAARAVDRGSACGELLGERLDLRAELSRLGQPRLVESDVAALGGLYRRQSSRPLRGQDGHPGVRIGQLPLGHVVAGGDPCEVRLDTLTGHDQVAESFVGPGRAVLDHPALHRRRSGRESVVAGVPGSRRPLRTGHVVAHGPVELRGRRGILPEPGHDLLLAGDLGDGPVGRQELLARGEQLRARLVVDQVPGLVGAGDHRCRVGHTLLGPGQRKLRRRGAPRGPRCPGRAPGHRAAAGRRARSGAAAGRTGPTAAGATRRATAGDADRREGDAREGQWRWTWQSAGRAG